ncbi:MAG: ATP-binding protein, partial [Candidatus Thorarchaeota archaeon]
MGLKDSIREYFETHPRAKKAIGVATAIAGNFVLFATGSPLLAAAAGSIIDARQEKDAVSPDEIMSFFKEAVQDPSIREAIKEAVREGGVEVASSVGMALNQLEATSPDAGRQVQSLKSEITVIEQQMGIIQDLLSYFEIPDSHERIMNVWRLPAYLDDVLVIDEPRSRVIDAAIYHAKESENVVILGTPGSGKTTIMYAIFRELDRNSDVALVWDTKDISRVHERSGVVLFHDDLPETRELVRAIIEKDVKGIVTTARVQEWSRLPIELREKFTSVTLPKMSDETMTEIAENHLKCQHVGFDEAILPILVESAQGSPIYVRYLAEEMGAQIMAGEIEDLTEELVRKAPKGMTDYVAGILARVLFDLQGTIFTPRAGAIPVIKTLLCLADMPSYETHEVHLNQIFFALKGPSDSPGPFNAIKQYLSRDPRFYSLKFMHDTLADVLRGGVDHPIVGDIRMLAQEMGVSGRLKVEKQALQDGWDHIKDEYDVEPTGGLEPLLAYAYFAAKNFGLDHLDSLAVELANKYMENPLSQGLFAIVGPISEVPTKEADSIVTEPVDDIIAEVDAPQAPPIPTAPAKPPGNMDEIGEAVRQSIQGERGEGIAEMVKKMEGLEDLAKIGEKIPGNLGDFVSQQISTALAGRGEEVKSSQELLEEVLEQESVSPRRLSRLLGKASRRAAVRAGRGKIKDKKATGDLLIRAAKRLVLLDSMMYIEKMGNVSAGLAATLGENRAAEVKLDEKSRKQIASVYDQGMKRCKNVGDFDGLFAHLSGKWELVGVDTKDIANVSDQIGRLMGY